MNVRLGQVSMEFVKVRTLRSVLIATGRLPVCVKVGFLGTDVSMTEMMESHNQILRKSQPILSWV